MSQEQPEWVTATACPGFLEIVKSGAVIDRIPIATGTKSISFGRLPDNTVCLEHESISRRHAVIYFGPGNSAFIYDLQSTHGTFLSKKQIPPLQYIKITHENDVFHFGGSTRMFILSLPPVAIQSNKEVSIEETGASEASRMRKAVLKFFDENGINQRDVQVSKTEGIISCSLDFAPYLSLESGEDALVLSSGTDKSEAWNAFFEDAYNLLLRLGLISPASVDKTDSESDIEDSEDEKERKEPKKVLTEADLVSKRDAIRGEIVKCNQKISNLLEVLIQTESQEVDDFDVFIRDAKIAEIKDDISKVERQKTTFEEELSHQEAILEAIGYKEPTVVENNDNVKAKESDVAQETEPVKRKAVVKEESVKEKESLKETKTVKETETAKETESNIKSEVILKYALSSKTEEQTKKARLYVEEPEYNQFEDATNPEEDTDAVQELKRKLGY